MLTIADLGILRDVPIEDGRVVVTITPTYSGCPAMDADRADVARRSCRRAASRCEVRTVLAPAWTTDWISARVGASWPEFGIAPPPGR